MILKIEKQEVETMVKPDNGYSVSLTGIKVSGATKDQAVDLASIGKGNATIFDPYGVPIIQFVESGPVFRDQGAEA